MSYRPKSVKASWKAQSPSTRLLRFWLGATWVFGGWDKATDHSFLTPGTVNYIGNQLRSFVDISPLGPLIQHSLEHATLVGWVVMITGSLLKRLRMQKTKYGVHGRSHHSHHRFRDQLQ